MKKYIAEFIGTFVLVTFGCGAAVAANELASQNGNSTPLGVTTLLIAFAFGLTVMAMAYSIGNISGCHINPAVSIGFLFAGKMSIADFIGYLIAQFAGGTVGALFLSFILQQSYSLGQNGYGDESAYQSPIYIAAVVEIVLTCIFVFVILCVTSKAEYSSIAGLIIGLTLTIIHIVGIPFTGTSVNPARSFGPAVVVGGTALEQLPIFILAPLVGGILAACLYKLLMEEKPAPVTAAEAVSAMEADENVADTATEDTKDSDEASDDTDDIEEKSEETV